MINNRDWWLDGLAKLRKLLTKPWSRRISLSDPVSFLLAHCADRAVTAKRQAEREECQSLGRFVEAALVGVVDVDSKTKIMASVDNFFDYVVERLMGVQLIDDQPVEKTEIELWWIDGLAKVKAIMVELRYPNKPLAHLVTHCEKVKREDVLGFIGTVLGQCSETDKVYISGSVANFLDYVESKVEGDGTGCAEVVD